MTSLRSAKALLIAFGGLPGTGKSTLARALARERDALYLRIDSIEQALRNSGAVKDDIGPTGYEIAYALAEDNLEIGRNVVADCVNPIALTRNAWRHVANNTSATLIEIETVCSDESEHRTRIETRTSDIRGLVLPTWAQVVARRYERWNAPHVTIDTAGKTIEAALAELRRVFPIIP